MTAMDEIQTLTSDLIRRQSEAVERRLRQILEARSVDPDDRTDGWEDRARDALADLHLDESVEWIDEYHARIVTTIRPRALAERIPPM